MLNIEYDISNIDPLSDKVIFQFSERVTNGKFINERESGLVDDLGHDYLMYGGISRKAVAIAIGAAVSGVKVGDEFIVENLKWTPEFVVNGESYWMTTDKHVLGIVKQ